jgi:ATP-binding protein involved in chromosome partitioning
MSYFTCPCCSEKTYIFGKDGCSKLVSSLGIDLLGEIPLYPLICSKSDQGTPIVVSEPLHPVSLAFIEIAKILKNKL